MRRHLRRARKRFERKLCYRQWNHLMQLKPFWSFLNGNDVLNFRGVSKWSSVSIMAHITLLNCMSSCEEEVNFQLRSAGEEGKAVQSCYKAAIYVSPRWVPARFLDGNDNTRGYRNHHFDFQCTYFADTKHYGRITYVTNPFNVVYACDGMLCFKQYV